MNMLRLCSILVLHNSRTDLCLYRRYASCPPITVPLLLVPLRLGKIKKISESILLVWFFLMIPTFWKLIAVAEPSNWCLQLFNFLNIFFNFFPYPIHPTSTLFATAPNTCNISDESIDDWCASNASSAPSTERRVGAVRRAEQRRRTARGNAKPEGANHHPSFEEGIHKDR